MTEKQIVTNECMIERIIVEIPRKIGVEWLVSKKMFSDLSAFLDFIKDVKPKSFKVNVIYSK